MSETELQEAQKERDQLRQQLTEAQAAIVVKDEAINTAIQRLDDINHTGTYTLLIQEIDQALQPNCGQPLLEVVKEMKEALSAVIKSATPNQRDNPSMCAAWTKGLQALTKAKEIGL